MKKISLKRVIKKIFNRTGITIMASVFLCAIGIGGGFGIAKLVRPQTIADETITLPDGTIFEKPNQGSTSTITFSTTAFSEGDGSKTNPYLITNFDDLCVFNYFVYKGTTANKFFKITADIDCEGKEWHGSSSMQTQNAYLDGGNHTISNLKIPYFGFFGRRFNNSTVINLNFDSCDYTSGTYSYSGCLLTQDATNSVFANMTITNCFYNDSNNSSIYGSFLSSTMSECNINNIVVKDSYIKAYSASVLAGSYLTKCEVFNCQSLNNLIEGTSVAGGVALGSGYNSFYNCLNTSTVKGKQAAGIVGSTDSVYGITIQYCVNKGIVESSSFACGIAKYGTMAYCSNYGNISSSGSYAFGLVYEPGGIVHDCANYGNVTASGTGSYYASVIGSTYSSVYNIINYGDIESASGPAGGVVSYIHNGVAIRNLINIGSVEGASGKMGGIVASINGYGCAINNSYYDSTVFDGTVYGFRQGYSASATLNNSMGIENLSTLIKDKDEMLGNGTLAWEEDYAWDFDNVWDIDETGTINEGYPYLRDRTLDSVLIISGEGIENSVRKDSFLVYSNDKYDDVVIYVRKKSASETEYSEWEVQQPWTRTTAVGDYQFYATYTNSEGTQSSTSVYSIKLDTKAPKITFEGAHKVINYGNLAYAYNSFSVTYEDDNDITFRYKYPGASSYTTTLDETKIVQSGDTYTILYTTDNFGKWSFTATDEAGNSSSAFEIYFFGDTWIADSNSDGVYDYAEQPSGEGTEESPYLIYESGELAWIATREHTFTYIELMADIDISAHQWAPINEFAGRLNGNGHTISGLTINRSSAYGQGLFGWSRSSAYTEIHDLNLEDVSMSIKGKSGGLIGSVAYAWISNCQVSGEISGKSERLGMFIGEINTPAANSKSYIKIEKSISRGELTSSQAVCGGFVGCAISVEMSDCINYTNVMMSGSSSYVGGLIGEFLSTYYCDKINITNCANYGNISANSYVGGIIGDISLASSRTLELVKISGCVNYGDVSGQQKGGGIVGYFCISSPSFVSGFDRLFLVENCHNFGDVSCTGVQVGGIIGMYSIYDLNGCVAKISKCTSTGKITASYYLGGLIGDFEITNTTRSQILIENCSVEGEFYVTSNSTSYTDGGLIGCLYITTEQEIKIKNCFLDVDIYLTTATTADHVFDFVGGTVSSLECLNVTNCVYGVNKSWNYSSSTETYDSTSSSKYYYDDGDDTVDTDFSEWFIHDNFNEGKPSLRSLYWIGANFEEQDIKSKLDDLGYLDLNHQDSSEEVA